MSNGSALAGGSRLWTVALHNDREFFVVAGEVCWGSDAKPADKKPEAPRSLSSLADLANIDMLMKNSADLGDEAEVDLASDEAQDLDVPLTSDYNFEDTAAEGEVEAESLDEFEEGDFDDEEEEDDDWGGRKTKQSKPQKQRRPERRPY